MSDRDVDNSLPKMILRAFGEGVVAGFVLINKFFESRFVSVVMVGLCLANLLILSELTVRWFNGGYVSRYNFIMGLINTLFLLYWWPKVKPHLLRSKQDKESSDVGHTSQA